MKPTIFRTIAVLLLIVIASPSFSIEAQNARPSSIRTSLAFTGTEGTPEVTLSLPAELVQLRCNADASVPTKERGYVYAHGSASCNGRVRSMSGVTVLMQYYRGSWHQVASQPFSANNLYASGGQYSLVRCTRNPTSYSFYSIFSVTVTYTNGRQQNFWKRSGASSLTC